MESVLYDNYLRYHEALLHFRIPILTADSQEPIAPYQKFFFICEGANTEVFYFKELINLRKELSIHPLIDICLLEKTDEDRNLSNPKRLIELWLSALVSKAQNIVSASDSD